MAPSPPKGRLYLHEEALLLSLREDKGTAERGTSHALAFGGSILAELLLHDRLRIGPGKKSPVSVSGVRPIGEPSLDEALARVRGAKRTRSAATWTTKFSSLKAARRATLERLCDRHILKEQHVKILGLIPRTVYPEHDPSPEREIRDRIDQAITQRDAEIDERTATLIAIATPTNLLRPTFGKAWVKANKARIQTIADDLPAGKATREAIAAIQTAVIAATVAASAAAAAG